jgi:hypothetical protein
VVKPSFEIDAPYIATNKVFGGMSFADELRKPSSVIDSSIDTIGPSGMSLIFTQGIVPPKLAAFDRGGVPPVPH